MTLLVFKTFLAKSWIWLKEHWQLPFLIAWSVVVWLFARRNTNAIIEVLEAKRNSYKRQVEVLRGSHNTEILKRQGLTKEYEKALEKVEREFAKKELSLSEKQKTDIKKMIAMTKGNPDEVKKKIEEEFGIKFVE